MPGRYSPTRRPPWRAQLKESSDSLDASVVVDENSDSWWAGTQLSFTSVATAIATATVGVAVATATAQFNQPADESPYPNSIQAFETWQVVETTDRRPDIGVFTSDDEIVPQPTQSLASGGGFKLIWTGQNTPVVPEQFNDDVIPQFVAEETEQPVFLVTLPTTFKQVWTVEDELPPILDEIYAWEAPRTFASLVSSLYLPDPTDTVPTTVATLGVDDEYWLQLPTDSNAVTLVVVGHDSGFISGPSIIEEEYWYQSLLYSVPVPPRFIDLTGVTESDIVPQPTFLPNEVYEWTSPRITRLVAPLYLPDSEEISAATLFGNLDDSLGPEFRAPLVKPWTTAWQVDDEIVPPSTTQSLASGGGYRMVFTGYDIPVVPEQFNDDIVPPATFVAEEDYWHQQILWIVLNPSQRLYLPDPEEIPSGQLFGNLDDSLGPMFLAPLVRPNTDVWGVGDDIVPQPIFIANDDYWLDLPNVDNDGIVIVTINIDLFGGGGGAQAVIVPLPVDEQYWIPPWLGVPPSITRYFWFNDEIVQPIPPSDEPGGGGDTLGRKIETTSVWDWTQVDEVPTPAAPLAVDELYWYIPQNRQAPLPPIQAFSADDEIIAFIPTEDSSIGSFSQLAVQQDVVWKWYATDEFPTAAAPLQIPESDWQVYTPDYPTPKFLYLPDPESLPTTLFGTPDEVYWSYFPPQQPTKVVSLWQVDDEIVTVVPLLIQESDWDVYTPSYLVAKPLYLPDGEEIPAGQLFAVPNEEYTLPSFFITVPSAKVATFWQVEDEIGTPTFLFSDEDYWLVTPIQVVRPIAPLFDFQDEVVPSLTIDEDQYLDLRARHVAPQKMLWYDDASMVPTIIDLDTHNPLWEGLRAWQRLPDTRIWSDDSLIPPAFAGVAQLTLADFKITDVALLDTPVTIVTLSDEPV